jgi:K+-transporting ATPase A subunit
VTTEAFQALVVIAIVGALHIPLGDWPLFIGLSVSAALLISALTFLPALALGPLAEALH